MSFTGAPALESTTATGGVGAMEERGGAVTLLLLFLWVLTGVLAVALAVSVGPADLAVSVVFGGILLLAGTIATKTVLRNDVQAAVSLFTAAFLLRFIAAALVVSAISLAGVEGLAGGKDYLNYEATGWRLAENWRAGRAVFGVSDANPGYYYLVAAVYTLTGRHLMAPLLLNAFFGSVAAVAVFQIGRILFGRSVGITAGYLAAFLPTLLFWSSLLYKDVMLSAVVAVVIYLVLQLRGSGAGTAPVWLGLALVPLFLIRPETGIIIVISILAYLTLSGEFRISRLLALVPVAMVMLGALFLLEAYGLGGKTAVLDRFVNPVSEAGQQREIWTGTVARKAEGFSTQLYGADLLRRPHLLILSLGMVFIIPVPGSAPWGMNFGTFMAPGQFVWLLLLPMVGYGVVWAMRHASIDRLFVLGVTGLLALGVVMAGYFSNPRYLVQVVPLMLIFAAVGLKRIDTWWREYGILVSGVGVISVIYLWIR